jgi:hypothetical protein
MMVAHDKMLAGDLKALHRMLKVVESQDRNRGFGHPRGRSDDRQCGRRARA